MRARGYLELSDTNPEAARARLTEMADTLLANPIIERYRVEVLA